MLELFFNYLNEISVSLMLLVILVYIYRCWLDDRSVSLEEMLVPAMSAASVPAGVALIICAFSPSYVSKLQSINIYLAMAGIALLYFAVQSIRSAVKPREKERI